MLHEIHNTVIDINPNELFWLSLDKCGVIEIWERSDKKQYEVQLNYFSGSTIHVRQNKQDAIELFNKLKNGTN